MIWCVRLRPAPIAQYKTVASSVVSCYVPASLQGAKHLHQAARAHRLGPDWPRYLAMYLQLLDARHGAFLGYRDLSRVVVCLSKVIVRMIRYFASRR